MVEFCYNYVFSECSNIFSHPDVMMGSYAQNAATPIFFVVYLVLTLYFASNVVSIVDSN